MLNFPGILVRPLAQNEELQRAHGGVDGQFRMLYNDKWVDLKIFSNAFT